jgi:hypothetical protein
VEPTNKVVRGVQISKYRQQPPQGRASLLLLRLVEDVAGQERRSKARATGVKVALRLWQIGCENDSVEMCKEAVRIVHIIQLRM